MTGDYIRKLIGKTKRKDDLKYYAMFTIAILAQILIFCVFKIFCWQRQEFYSPTQFKINEDILYSFQNNIGNFDVYIIDRTSDVDLIFFHGAGIHEDKYKERVRYLKDTVDCNIILPFYRNFGTSKGKVSDITTMTDMHILGHALKKRNKITYVYGLSFGCATGIYIANVLDVAGMILENPFYNLKSVVAGFKVKRFFRFLITDDWPNYQVIKNVKCRILFLISKKDRLISPKDGERLSEIYSNARIYYSRDSDHTNMYKIDKAHRAYFLSSFE